MKIFGFWVFLADQDFQLRDKLTNKEKTNCGENNDDREAVENEIRADVYEVVGVGIHLLLINEFMEINHDLIFNIASRGVLVDTLCMQEHI